MSQNGFFRCCCNESAGKAALTRHWAIAKKLLCKTKDKRQNSLNRNHICENKRVVTFVLLTF